MNQKRALAALALIPLIALLASCGSSTTRLSSSDYTTKMNALCKSEQSRTKYLDNENIFNLSTATKVWPKTKTIESDVVDHAADFNPPKNLEDAHDGWIDSVRDAIGQLDGLTQAAKDGQEKAYSQRLLKLINQVDGANRAIAKYAKSCFNEDDTLPPAQSPEAGAATVTIGAKEYRFDIPTGTGAGKTALKLANHGNELHVLGLSKLHAGVTFEQLKAKVMENPEGDTGLSDDVGISAPAAPDDSSILNADLEPGTYAVFCFIPSPSGKSHFELGMLQPFTVS